MTYYSTIFHYWTTDTLSANRCGEDLTRNSGVSSTGNLNNHVKACSLKDDLRSQQDLMDSTFARGSTYTWEKARTLIMLWIACRRRPYSIVEDPELLELIKMLHTRAEIPCCMTVSNDIRTLYQLSVTRIREQLKVSE